MDPKADFYCRYYVGHKGKFGHEFLEFEFTASGLVSTVTCSLFDVLLLGVTLTNCLYCCSCDMQTIQTIRMTQ